MQKNSSIYSFYAFYLVKIWKHFQITVKCFLNFFQQISLCWGNLVTTPALILFTTAVNACILPILKFANKNVFFLCFGEKCEWYLGYLSQKILKSRTKIPETCQATLVRMITLKQKIKKHVFIYFFLKHL